MSRLEVQVMLTQRLDAAGAATDALQITARNPGRALTLGVCGIVLPLGLVVYADPPAIEYPLRLETGAQCSDYVGCRPLAEECRSCGYHETVRLQAVFAEDARWGVHPAEHRSDTFDFAVDRWLTA